MSVAYQSILFRTRGRSLSLMCHEQWLHNYPPPHPANYHRDVKELSHIYLEVQLILFQTFPSCFRLYLIPYIVLYLYVLELITVNL